MVSLYVLQHYGFKARVCVWGTECMCGKLQVDGAASVGRLMLALTQIIACKTGITPHERNYYNCHNKIIS